ncbi:MAG: PEP-CTERM sorting domain-containing protein [Woronichinia naegeliana WA131]|jgi:hypothetical protein|uniref:PEP-CTERM sorting domain-containing protein n=1 Tax=Woronichinia naegeliana WA131 TaxID=2824559 RepID=A0A977PW04_9CYAN|nr:MAG: PEP-CTERM sorting domain-containing protein [Woronichinia naegeliana WA131]
MFNQLKIKTDSVNINSLIGTVAVIALTRIFLSSAPANAASITYSRWANIGPQTIGDGDNGKFTLKITDGEDVGQKGKALFQFSSNTLADANYISTVYFQDKGGLFATTTTTTTTTAKNGKTTTTTTTKYNASVSTTFSDAAANTSSLSGLDFAYGTATLSQGNSIGFNTSFSFDKAGSGGNKSSISPGETLGILVDLSAGKTFNDILNSLTQNDNLIVAAHIIGYANSRSDGFYYGNPFAKGTTPPAGTDSPVFYDTYKTTSDPNPATVASAPSDTVTPPSSSAVPEPFTILGSATALGLGASFKRRLAKATKGE